MLNVRLFTMDWLISAAYWSLQGKEHEKKEREGEREGNKERARGRERR